MCHHHDQRLPLLWLLFLARLDRVAFLDRLPFTHLPFLFTNPFRHLGFFSLAFSTVVFGGGARLPAPENVWLDGAPYSAACADASPRQSSGVVHSGGEATDGKPPFTRAS